jgi:polar amino acid transport system permease protein
LAVLPAVLVLAGCTSAGPSSATYRVGVTSTGVPFTFLNAQTNAPQGVLVDIIREVGADAGFVTDVQVMPFGALIPSLTSGRIEIISAAMVMTEARREVVDFSDPVYAYGEGLIVAASDRSPYTAYADLRGAIVGAQSGTIYVEPLRDSGVFREVRIYDSLADIMRDVGLGRIAAGFGDHPVLAYHLSQERRTDVRLVDTYRPTLTGGVGIAVRKADSALLARINSALARLKARGTLDRVLAKWNVPPSTATGAQARIATPATPSPRTEPQAPSQPQTASSESVLQDVRTFLPVLATGAVITVWVTVGALALSTVLGLIWGLMRVSQVQIVARVGKTVVDVIRGIPIIVQLFYIYFVLPEFGIQLSAFQAGVIGLGLAYSAYQAEIFRAGIQAVDAGQIEAAQSLGMRRGLVLRRVILPQAIRMMLPPYGNTMIMMLKDSSQASAITVAELALQGRLIASATFKSTTVFTLVALLYLSLSVPLILLTSYLERRFQRR